MKEIKAEAKSLAAKKATAITGGPLKTSGHADLALKGGGKVGKKCADGGSAKKRGGKC